MINATTIPATSAKIFNQPTGEQIAEEKICVQCGRETRDILRCDYTIAENVENDFPFPQGGYMCQECDEDIYATAHAEGSLYCPAHGFVESCFNARDDDGEYIGCYEGCPDAAEYDRQIKEKMSRAD